jgi:hypothetical protein
MPTLRDVVEPPVRRRPVQVHHPAVPDVHPDAAADGFGAAQSDQSKGNQMSATNDAIEVGRFTQLIDVYRVLDDLTAEYRRRGLHDHADAILVASARIALARRDKTA